MIRVNGANIGVEEEDHLGVAGRWRGILRGHAKGLAGACMFVISTERVTGVLDSMGCQYALVLHVLEQSPVDVRNIMIWMKIPKE
ncbi:conserved hypothetical protein [Ricinus communis]|uniref:Uncharacterized protein n=1 Tax=Ricinus communis TaxID=3988 RepID=B9REE9_RICCO|nr:conserved hypothetical protein [Ricinus communis]